MSLKPAWTMVGNCISKIFSVDVIYIEKQRCFRNYDCIILHENIL